MKWLCLSGVLILGTASGGWANCLPGPASARLVLTDGIVLDPATGLEWQMCLHGHTTDGEGCAGEAVALPWLEADQIASDIGWRLPTLEDLDTILSGDGDGGLFPKPFGVCQSGQIWTASPGFPVNDVAAIVELDTGLIWGTGKGVARPFIMVRGEIDVAYFDGAQPKL